MTEVTLQYVEQLADKLSVEDQQRLSAHLTKKLHNGALTAGVERKPQDLYGIWKGAFPEDLDVEAALYEIRHEWEEELEEFGP